MRKLFLFISTAILLASCGEEKKDAADKGLLSTDLVNNPASAAGTNPSDLAKLATMDFADTAHNFGTMQEGEVVTYDFEFKNNGRSPLLISSAKGSCGCTAPDYPHEAIKPGEKGIVKVKFNSDGKPNHQEKSVTITSNARQGVNMLYIKADVTPRKD